MRRLLIGIALVTVGIVVAACSSGGSGGTGGTIEGINWKLTSYDFGGTDTAVPAGLGVDATFKAGKVAGARFVLSGVAPAPWRLPAVEKLLTGQKLDPRMIARAADAAVVGANPLEHNGYKVPLVHGLIEEVLGGIPAA
mgnify:CR=1 FL=1